MTDTKDHILRTAFSFFIKKSYKAVTMSDLEKATGLTKGAFYHYFKSKEEIYIEVIDKYYLANHIPRNETIDYRKNTKGPHVEIMVWCED